MFDACGDPATARAGSRRRARNERADGGADDAERSSTARRSRSAGNDFEHGGEVAARVKAILKQLGHPAGRDPAALDRQLRGGDERDHVRRRGGAGAPGPRRRGPGRPGRPRPGDPGHRAGDAGGLLDGDPGDARSAGFGAGLGLPNIKRNSDEFEIESTVGVGHRRCATSVVPGPTAADGGSMDDRTSHSIVIDPSKCIGCVACSQGLPDQGDPRPRRRSPVVKPELCIDCGACIRRLPLRRGAAQDLRRPSDLKRFKYTVAMPSLTLYAQFGATSIPSQVLHALTQVGFDSTYDISWMCEMVAGATDAYLSECRGPVAEDLGHLPGDRAPDPDPLPGPDRRTWSRSRRRASWRPSCCAGSSPPSCGLEPERDRDLLHHPVHARS